MVFTNQSIKEYAIIFILKKDHVRREKMVDGLHWHMGTDVFFGIRNIFILIFNIYQ